MSCYFFCDTGSIIGYCDTKDYHHHSCDFFFNKYPKDKNSYYITDVVKGELQGKRRKYLRNSKNSSPSEITRIRKIQQCIDIHIHNIEKFNCKDSHPHLNDLIITLQKIIKIKGIQQINDIKIVAHAIIWSIKITEDSSTLITVDKKDLSSKESKIQRECGKIVAQPVTLSMLYLPDYYNYKVKRGKR
jgi:hypothetical protein